MRTRIYVPRETAAISVGADDVAIAIARYAKENKHDIELIRNGSWGATWLEPMVEVVVGDQRIAYGNVEAGDVADLFAAGLLEGGEHDKVPVGEAFDVLQHQLGGDGVDEVGEEDDQ